MNTVSPAVDLTTNAAARAPGSTWTVSQVEALYQMPLMDLLARQVEDPRVRRLVRRYLEAGVMALGS